MANLLGPRPTSRSRRHPSSIACCRPREPTPDQPEWPQCGAVRDQVGSTLILGVTTSVPVLCTACGYSFGFLGGPQAALARVSERGA